MSLGRVGLVGSLGRKTTANICIMAGVHSAVSTGGTRRGKVGGGNDLGVDNRYDDPMPYDGKFTELRLQQNVNWQGTLTLMINGVGTALTITISSANDHAIKKIVVDVPFVAGDLVRFNWTNSAIGGFRDTTTLLLGGFTVTN